MKFKVGDWLSQVCRNGDRLVYQIVKIHKNIYSLKFIKSDMIFYNDKKYIENGSDWYCPAEYLTQEEKIELL